MRWTASVNRDSEKKLVACCRFPGAGQPRYGKAISVVVLAVRRTKSAERQIILIIMVQSPAMQTS
jgi:hypothetical protein